MNQSVNTMLAKRAKKANITDAAFKRCDEIRFHKKCPQVSEHTCVYVVITVVAVLEVLLKVIVVVIVVFIGVVAVYYRFEQRLS